MKLKLLLGILFVAGIAAALAVASPSLAVLGTTSVGTATTSSTTTITTTGEKKHDDEHGQKGEQGQHGKKAKQSCQKVQLRGSNGSGTVAVTVDRANHGGASLVGKQVTLTIPAGARVQATACLDAAGALTLRGLEIKVAKSQTTTTGTTTTTHS